MKSNLFLEVFEDPERVRSYADGPRRFTPGFADVHRMVNVLLRERVPHDGKVLVHGAGGGLELEALAGANPGWQFVGVDPAGPMLDAARERLGDEIDRVMLHQGFIDSAPPGPFDGATSLLTLHFLDAEDRRETVAGIVERLKPGAPLIVVHSSFPQRAPDRDVWMSRYEGFAISSGVDPDMAGAAREAVSAMTTMFEPEKDMEILMQAGLTDVSSFYSAFTWHGWVGFAP